MAVLIGGTSREKHHEQHELYQECHRDLLFAAFEYVLRDLQAISNLLAA
jgi:hypothetical protein